MLDNLPLVNEEAFSRANAKLEQLVTTNQVSQWLNSELKDLLASNKPLYNHLIDRSRHFASAVMMVQDAQSIAVSYTLEMILMLVIVNDALGGVKDIHKFDNLMNKLFGKDDLGELGKL